MVCGSAGVDGIAESAGIGGISPVNRFRCGGQHCRYHRDIRDFRHCRDRSGRNNRRDREHRRNGRVSRSWGTGGIRRISRKCGRCRLGGVNGRCRRCRFRRDSRALRNRRSHGTRQRCLATFAVFVGDIHVPTILLRHVSLRNHACEAESPAAVLTRATANRGNPLWYRNHRTNRAERHDRNGSQTANARLPTSGCRLVVAARRLTTAQTHNCTDNEAAGTHVAHRPFRRPRTGFTHRLSGSSLPQTSHRPNRHAAHRHRARSTNSPVRDHPSYQESEISNRQSVIGHQSVDTLPDWTWSNTGLLSSPNLYTPIFAELGSWFLLNGPIPVWPTYSMSLPSFSSATHSL